MPDVGICEEIRGIDINTVLNGSLQMEQISDHLSPIQNITHSCLPVLEEMDKIVGGSTQTSITTSECLGCKTIVKYSETNSWK
uniref:Uncharacterized protein n=1 Tax=Oryza nivara TaxID=4536 RepID=A0A0E0HY55_ORYNI